MIKLIASDLDGTLLLNSAQSLTQRQIDIIGKILDKGIIFAAASGRQCRSLEMLFGSLADRMVLIAENGALVKYQGKILDKSVMDKKVAMDIINDVYNRPGCEVLISGQTKSYIRPKSEDYYNRMTKVVKYDCEIVDDFRQITEDIIKVAVCDYNGSANSKDYFHSKWDVKAKVTVSGPLYIDFTHLSVNKGNAMGRIQQRLGIAPDECMAFGDNFNDIELLDSVVESYVMDSAADQVKNHGKYIVNNVEDTLENIFLK
ncbi:MAG: HAD family hydrolase [Lachnospiraceae bacterium]